MDNSKTPLPEAMENIDDNNDVDGNTRLDNNQQVDLDNPMLHTIDTNGIADSSAGFDNSQAGSDATQGLTPMHRQNMDESRVDEVLVEDNLDDSDYPDIIDIADRDAAEHSNSDDL